MMHIRPATAADQAAITAIVRAARLNPLDLDWRRFLVAEADGQITGVVQVRPHSDGSRELASLAVLPAQQGRGVGGALIGALLERERGPLHLMCEEHLAGYYARFGFRRLALDEMPRHFRRFARLVQIIGFFARLAGQRVGLAVMVREE
jgi:N-acetylglutamate synthase-like GNAT family acetyltransferase